MSVAPLSILVADDDADFRQLVVDFLGIQGFHVETAHNGEEAVQMAKAHQPDMMLLDIDMPKKNGLEATVELRADPHTKNIKIMYLSNLENPVVSATTEASRELVKHIGPADYFRKGSDLETLAAHIRASLS